jgi:hypothetical protein
MNLEKTASHREHRDHRDTGCAGMMPGGHQLAIGVAGMMLGGHQLTKGLDRGFPLLEKTCKTISYSEISVHLLGECTKFIQPRNALCSLRTLWLELGFLG